MTPVADATRERSIDPRIKQRRVEVARNRARRRLRRLLIALAAVVVVVAGLVALHSSWLSTNAVMVEGLHPHTSQAAIVAASGLGHHPPLVDVDPGATAQRVEALPFIATATVARHWPDGVSIAVTERVPVVEMAGPAAAWSTLDGTGRTLAVGATRPTGLVQLVVGLRAGPLAPPVVGRFLPALAAAGLEVCRTLPPAFSAQVVSVTVARDGTVSLALTSGITVLVGTGADLTAKYEDVAAIIAHASLKGIRTIDVTVPAAPTVSG